MSLQPGQGFLPGVSDRQELSAPIKPRSSFFSFLSHAFSGLRDVPLGHEGLFLCLSDLSKFIFVFDMKYGSRFTFPSGAYIQSAGWEGRGCPIHTVAPGAATPLGPLPHPLLLPRDAWAAHSPAPPPGLCRGVRALRVGLCLRKLGAGRGDSHAPLTCVPPPVGTAPQRALCKPRQGGRSAPRRREKNALFSRKVCKEALQPRRHRSR